jgi:glycosyltransferase involved in cell wall biosynthesis
MTPERPRAPRIVHIISALVVGGAERLLVDLMVSLRPDERAMATVVVMNEVDPVLRARLDEAGVRIETLDRTRGSRDPRYLARLLSIVGSDPVVIHAHNRGSKFWAMLVRALRPRARLVFTVHAMNVATGYGALHRTLHNCLVDRTIAVSRAVQQDCQRGGIKNTRIIRNGVHVTRFRPPVETAQCRLEREPHRVPEIVTVARLVHSIKGQDVLIEAAAQLKAQGIATRLRFIGSPSRDQPETPAFLRALVANYGLGENVVFDEGVSDASGALRDADICAVPSREEGFGLVIVEAMAAGVPVVASRLDGPGELVRPGATGELAEQGDPADLASKIAGLLNDRPRASRMAREARSVAETHDIAVMRDACLDLYRSLAG